MKQIDNLGNRMKDYENIQRLYLTKRTPTIIRIDGKSFHTFTKGFDKPIDILFVDSMWKAAKYLCETVMNCQMAYVQSDEISLLLIDDQTLKTESWFGKNVVKMIAVSASMATMEFNKAFIQNVIEHSDTLDEKLHNRYKKVMGTAMFDSRAFTLPEAEVANYFIWRQWDATRNAIKAIGQFYFSHGALHKKNNNQIQEMLWQEKNINFNDCPTYQKRGVCIIKETYYKDDIERSRWIVDKEIPIFTQDRKYIERYLSNNNML